MNTSHPFTPSQINQLLCAKCYRSESLHGDKTECESCSNTGKLEKIGDLWLCENCVRAEKQHVAFDKGELVLPIDRNEKLLNDIKELSSDKITTPDGITASITNIEHQAINKLGSQAIQKSEDFFNARIKPIYERWKEIESDNSIPLASDKISILTKHETHAIEVKEHLLHMRSVLFQAIEVQLESIANMRSDQVYLNSIAGKIREEIRAKLHLENIDYVPPVIPKKIPKKINLNTDDGMAEFYAKKMNISVEAAKRIINARLREVIPCTCAETPGICKLHSKG